MHILSHPDVRLVDEVPGYDGGVFAPVLRVGGPKRTITEYHRMMREEVADLAAGDFELRLCEVMFFDTDQPVTCSEKEEDGFFAEQVKRTFGVGSDPSMYYFDERGPADYYAASMHAHPGHKATTSVTSRSGSIPSVFFRNPVAFANGVASAVKAVGGEVANTFDKHMELVPTDASPEFRAQVAATSISEMHGTKLKPDIIEVHRLLFDSIDDKDIVNRLPVMGRANIIGPRNPHGSNSYQYDHQQVDEPGELLVDLLGNTKVIRIEDIRDATKDGARLNSPTFVGTTQLPV